MANANPPPVPPAGRSPKGGSANPGSASDIPEQQAAHHDRKRDTEQQGRQGNTKQNTTNQGYQQDR